MARNLLENQQLFFKNKYVQMSKLLILINFFFFLSLLIFHRFHQPLPLGINNRDATAQNIRQNLS